MNRVFVTGAAGFIGSTMVDRLLSMGYQVIGWDNFSTGQKRFLYHAKRDLNFQLHVGNLLTDKKRLTDAMHGCDTVFHFAANADVRFGLDHPTKDLEQNTVVTSNVLEAMRANGIKRIVFSSTGSVYGESRVIPTPEDAPFPIQTSLYGASKIACEGLISAYCAGYGYEGYIFRFVSILGERYTHGHIFDFYKQLKDHPEYLTVLGDGTQVKSYLYIGDCIDAILSVLATPDEIKKMNCVVYNLGSDETVRVKDSIQYISEHLKLNPELRFTGGNQGWIGDNPYIFLNTNKIWYKTGWRADLSIKDGVIKTVEWLQKNEWVYEKN